MFEFKFLKRLVVAVGWLLEDMISKEEVCETRRISLIFLSILIRYGNMSVSFFSTIVADIVYRNYKITAYCVLAMFKMRE